MTPILFVHIPKTAGTTLRTVVVNQVNGRKVFVFGRDWEDNLATFLAKPQTERDAYEAIIGHQHYGLHRHLTAPKVTYITFLRHPVERFLSWYSHSLNLKNARHHKLVKTTPLTDLARLPMQRDYQMRWILGYAEDGAQGAVYGDDVPLPDNAFEIAKTRLTTEFAFAGIVEQFDACLLLMQDALGWRDTYYARQNSTEQRLRYKDLNDEQRRAVDELAGPDFELYDLVRADIQRRIDAGGAAFQARLADFQRKNPAIGVRRERITRVKQQVKQVLRRFR